MSNRVITFHGATLGVSELDIPAADVVIHGGEPLFLTATGVVGFDSEADAPATSYIETGDLAFAPGSINTATRAYLTHQADGAMTLATTASVEGDPVVVEYNVPEQAATVDRTRIVRLGRGPRGVSWAFRLGAEAVRWSLSDFQLQIERVKRRY